MELSPEAREKIAVALRRPLSYAGLIDLGKRVTLISEEDHERRKLRRRMSGTVQFAEIPARHETKPETIVDEERLRLARIELEATKKLLESKMREHLSLTRDRSIRLSEEHRVAELVARDAARRRSYAPPLRRNYELS